MQGGIGAMYWDKLLLGQVGDISVKKGVLSTVNSCSTLQEIGGGLRWRPLNLPQGETRISTKTSRAPWINAVCFRGNVFWRFAACIQTDACVIKSSMRYLRIIHVSRPTAITTSSSPQWRWWSWWWDGQNRETIWEDMHALDVWRARRRRVRVCNCGVIHATSPGLPLSSNRIGTSAGWGDLPEGRPLHILKPSPGCLRWG